MRVFAMGLLAAALSFAQVQNAADASAGPGSSPIAPGSLAFVSDYYSSTRGAGASVAIRPVGSSSPIPAQVVNATVGGITFLVPLDVPFGNAQVIYKQSGQLTQWAPALIAPDHFALYRSGTPGPLTALSVSPDGHSVSSIGLGESRAAGPVHRDCRNGTRCHYAKDPAAIDSWGRSAERYLCGTRPRGARSHADQFSDLPGDTRWLLPST